MEIPDSTSLCTRLRSALEGILEWKWDGRFGTILAEFPSEKKQGVQDILGRYLVHRWDSVTIGEAPQIAQRVNGRLGGLMSGQMLLVSDPEDDPLVYCAWWPWGDGQAISIRIGRFSEMTDAEVQSSLTEELKSWFGV